MKINLERNSQYNKYTSEDYLKKIILIQKWWKKMLNNKNKSKGLDFIVIL